MREEESPPAAPPCARAQPDWQLPKRTKVTERAHSESEAYGDQEDADEDEEEQEEAADESQAGSSQNGDRVISILSAIHQELRYSSTPSPAMGSPLGSFTSFLLV